MDKRANYNEMKEDCNLLYIFSHFISFYLLFTVNNYVEGKITMIALHLCNPYDIKVQVNMF